MTQPPFYNPVLKRQLNVTDYSTVNCFLSKPCLDQLARGTFLARGKEKLAPFIVKRCLILSFNEQKKANKKREIGNEKSAKACEEKVFSLQSLVVTWLYSHQLGSTCAFYLVHFLKGNSSRLQLFKKYFLNYQLVYRYSFFLCETVTSSSLARIRYFFDENALKRICLLIIQLYNPALVMQLNGDELNKLMNEVVVKSRRDGHYKWINQLFDPLSYNPTTKNYTTETSTKHMLDDCLQVRHPLDEWVKKNGSFQQQLPIKSQNHMIRVFGVGLVCLSFGSFFLTNLFFGKTGATQNLPIASAQVTYITSTPPNCFAALSMQANYRRLKMGTRDKKLAPRMWLQKQPSELKGISMPRQLTKTAAVAMSRVQVAHYLAKIKAADRNDSKPNQSIYYIPKPIVYSFISSSEHQLAVMELWQKRLIIQDYFNSSPRFQETRKKRLVSELAEKLGEKANIEFMEDLPIDSTSTVTVSFMEMAFENEEAPFKLKKESIQSKKYRLRMTPRLLQESSDSKPTLFFEYTLIGLDNSSLPEANVVSDLYINTNLGEGSPYYIFNQKRNLDTNLVCATVNYNVEKGSFSLVFDASAAQQ